MNRVRQHLERRLAGSEFHLHFLLLKKIHLAMQNSEQKSFQVKLSFAAHTKTYRFIANRKNLADIDRSE